MRVTAGNYRSDSNIRGYDRSHRRVSYTGSADTGSSFRISNCQYVYNLSASALGVGTYRADIKINGTVVGNAIFQLK